MPRISWGEDVKEAPSVELVLEPEPVSSVFAAAGGEGGALSLTVDLGMLAEGCTYKATIALPAALADPAAAASLPKGSTGDCPGAAAGVWLLCNAAAAAAASGLSVTVAAARGAAASGVTDAAGLEIFMQVRPFIQLAGLFTLCQTDRSANPLCRLG